MTTKKPEDTFHCHITGEELGEMMAGELARAAYQNSIGKLRGLVLISFVVNQGEEKSNVVHFSGVLPDSMELVEACMDALKDARKQLSDRKAGMVADSKTIQ